MSFLAGGYGWISVEVPKFFFVDVQHNQDIVTFDRDIDSMNSFVFNTCKFKEISFYKVVENKKVESECRAQKDTFSVLPRTFCCFVKFNS